ncbi:MAG: esterase [Bacteroidales bacterium]|nr:esterase [Bacteroidales bacterium]
MVFQREPVVVSPEILKDHRVTFRLYAPEATEISISGEWMEYGNAEKMARNDTGLWTYTTAPLPEELYGYSFAVNGIKAIDPNNAQVKRDGARYENFFIIPGNQSNLYVINDVPHGTLSKIWYDSPVLSMQRRVYVYTPAGYEGSTSRYPVFYLLHGGGGDEDAWSTMGRTCQIMDNLIAQGKAKPMIVVMTNGNANQSAAQNDIPFAQDQGMAGMVSYAGKFEESLVKDVIPFIEKNFRAYNDKDHRALAGLSMGGGHTVTVTTENPNTFSYIGVFSAGLRSIDPQAPDAAKLEKERDARLEALKNSGYKLYWIGCGEDDFVKESSDYLRKTLDRLNFKYTYRESSGGHSWANWRIYLSEFAPLLF